MNILALDAAAKSLSVALGMGDKNEETFLVETSGPCRHAELAVKAIDTAFGLAGLEKNALDAALVMEGPGSFTGLRIAYSAAKALSLSLGIRCAACPTLDVLAWPHRRWGGLVAPLLDAGGNSGKTGARFFTALYRGGKRLTPYMDDFAVKITHIIEETLLNSQTHEPVLLTGPAAPFFGGDFLVSPDYHAGHSLDLLRFALETGVLEKERAPLSAPLYIRKPVETAVETAPP